MKVTFDIDCLDPAYAPGTGTPVSGGPSSAKILSVIRKLGDVTLDYGGRVYLAKDDLLPPNAFERMYPELPIFRGVLAQLDPKVNFQSDMARRLKVRG